MIYRFRKVTKNLYRGSAPSPKEVSELKDKFNIKKIVSLDEQTGNRIDRACQILNIKHIMLPIEFNNFKQSLLNLLKHDLKKLFLEEGPTFVHCLHGKDRTSFAISLVQCKYLGKSAEEAIKESKELGFGVDVDPKIINIFEKLIWACKPEEDNNNADIVSNEREYIGDNRDSFLDEGHQGSFAPYLNVTKQNYQDSIYNDIVDQSPTRENYNSYKSIKQHNKEDNSVPLVGQYNNGAGLEGAGPVFPSGGFISD